MDELVQKQDTDCVSSAWSLHSFCDQIERKVSENL
jgi:hypothetical protein